MIAGAERIELPLTVLETAVLPLYQAPIFSFPKAYALQVLQNYTLKKSIHLCSFLKITFSILLWSSPRPISINQLHTLLYFHL